MNRRELNSINMMRTVYQFLTIHQSSWINKPSINEAYVKLGANISEIETHSKIQATDVTVETTIKSQTKEKLTATTLRITEAMGAVATAKSDTRLKAMSDISENDLNHLREDNYVIKIQAIYQAAIAIAPELMTWEITQSDIESLNTGASTFKQHAPDNSNLKVLTIEATANIKARLSETSALLNDTLDPLMLPFKTLNPTLHAEYTIARRTVDRAATHSDKPTPTE
jgi:hypothetical protein